MLLGPKWLEVALCVFFVIFGTSKMSLASISVDPWQQAREMGPGINFLYDDPIWQDPKKARFQEVERHFADIAQAEQKLTRNAAPVTSQARPAPYQQ